ncbi:TauD/TfdA family dioxygenase [Plantactinospora sp. KLBMP9567]|uniref:TauD/TfdA family dioxygenase n=1 Tax=Plantactinospora sp. KLBMP9567 TaxID=3085900 RepID=UPI002980A57B|nr:TauD/TfdA family dioxygenase [Plantactinospora sp. KLBMP9567]MDW5329515.1 TauD/TfdA family dioxygenase [Plantactinospora sp. KLBMP9567]
MTIELTAAESARMRRTCLGSAGEVGDAPLDSERLLTDVEVAAGALPERLLRALSRFRRSGNPFGTLRIRNVPIDDSLVPTPDGGDVSDWRCVPVATIAQLMVVSRLGEVIAYADEKGGRVVQDVVPVKGAEQRQENCGSTFLELHTEDGFHPFKPDFLTLLCMRGDPASSPYTITCAAQRVLPWLAEETVATLRQPLFRIRHSISFTGSGRARHSAAMPVLSGPATSPELVTDMYATEPLTAEAQRAFDELREAMAHCLTGTVLMPGDMLLVDNRAAVHGRTGFTARYDGTDRWLRRCFAVADLHPSRGLRAAGSPVCAPLATMAGETSGWPPAATAAPARVETRS